MHYFNIIIAAAQISALLWAAYCDVANRLIPNYICISLAITGLIDRLQYGLVFVATSLVVSFGLFVILLIMYIRRWLGGGDVKLLVAIALGLPPTGVPTLIYVMTMAGGILAGIYLIMRRLPRPHLASNRSVFRRIYAVERWRIFKCGPLPYGVAIACGGIWAVLGTGV